MQTTYPNLYLPLNFLRVGQPIASVFVGYRKMQLPKFEIWSLDQEKIGSATVASPPPFRNSYNILRKKITTNWLKNSVLRKHKVMWSNRKYIQIQKAKWACMSTCFVTRTSLARALIMKWSQDMMLQLV